MGEIALDDRRALYPGVEFSNQGRAVEHHPALFYGHDLHPFPAQRLTHSPLLSLDLDLALAVDSQYPGALGILPARWFGIVAPRAGVP